MNDKSQGIKLDGSGQVIVTQVSQFTGMQQFLAASMQQRFAVNALGLNVPQAASSLPASYLFHAVITKCAPSAVNAVSSKAFALLF